MRVRAVDPADDQEFAVWFAVVHASLEQARPGDAHWLPRELRTHALSLVRRTGSGFGQLFSAVVDGKVVGAMRVEAWDRDNAHLVDVLLEVHPSARRQGVGTALLEHARAWGREHGRTTLNLETDDVPDAPGRPFLEASGGTCGITESRRDLRLPPDPTALERLALECAPHAQGYVLRTWRDRVPDDLLDGRALLQQRMSTDAPSGDMPWEEEDWDGARWPEQEDLLRAMNRSLFGAGFVRDGVLAAYSDLAVPGDDPRRIYQWGTLVLREHRGHRLGVLVKLATLRAVVDAFPEAQLISTWNQEDNVWMVRTNEALGFRRNGTLSSWAVPVAGQSAL